MNYSVREQITRAIATQLKTITVANGYEIDVAEVHRPRRTGERYAPQAYGIGLLQGDCQRAEDEDFVGNPGAIGWRASYPIDLIIRQSETDADPMDELLNTFEADVQKALMADVTWGGLAIRSELGASEYPAGGDGVEGVTVWLYVIYRVSETDPYTNRV